MNEETTLSDQCVQGEGLVQVNLELKSVDNTDRINILDVLKPQDNAHNLDEPTEENSSAVLLNADDVSRCELASSASGIPDVIHHQLNSSHNLVVPRKASTASSKTASITTVLPVKNLNGPRQPTASSENITRLVMDSNFRKDQERLGIPLGTAYS